MLISIEKERKKERRKKKHATDLMFFKPKEVKLQFNQLLSALNEGSQQVAFSIYYFS